MYGEHPTLKRVKGILKKYCETCKREMRVTNKCESHIKDREPCYYCHLTLLTPKGHRINGDNNKEDTKKSSEKKSLKTQA